MKKSSLVFITMVFIVSCSTDDARQATLMPGAKPATRYHLNTGTSKPNPTDEQIRLIKAQTDAKARLAEIEARKAERLKKLETQRAMTVAQLEAEKTQKVKALELEQTKNTNTAQTQIATTKAQTDVAIEKERQSTAVVRQKEQLGFYRQLTIAAVIIILLLMLLAYFLYRHRQNLKLKIHEDGLRHQAYLEASRQHHEKVTKMLEIIADESTDKGLKKELTRLLKDTEEKPSVLLEHKG
jgi:hypothetical protein